MVVGSSDLCRKEYVDAEDQRNNLKQPNGLIWTLPYKLHFVILELSCALAPCPILPIGATGGRLKGYRRNGELGPSHWCPVCFMLWSDWSTQCWLKVAVKYTLKFSQHSLTVTWPLTETNSRQLNSPNSLGLSPNSMGPSFKLSHISPRQVVSFPWQLDFQPCRSPLSRF